MTLYGSRHTQRGLQLMAAAVSGTPLNISIAAIGDGNGNPVTMIDVEDLGRTALMRECWRGGINAYYQSAADPALYIAEVVVPVSVGGFVAREIGLFTADGELFVYGNLPDSVKPDPAMGATEDTVYLVAFRASNAGIVNITIDPSVAVVTWTMLQNYINSGALLPPGGATGFVLTKLSNANGDAGWRGLDDMDVNVNSIEEIQTLAEDQTEVLLAVVSTEGLAVYIDEDGTGGRRLTYGPDANQWLKDEDEPFTKIILGQSYEAGTKIILCQNEPAGRMTEPLARQQNLADILDKPLARENLGVLSKEVALALQPPGICTHFAAPVAPAGFLGMNGALISDAAYPKLVAVLGKRWNKPGDPEGQSRLPDGRGVGFRGWDNGRGIDDGRVFGSFQKASMLFGDDGAGSVATPNRVATSKSKLGWDVVSAADYAGATTRFIIAGTGNSGITDGKIGGARMANIALLAVIKHD